MVIVLVMVVVVLVVVVLVVVLVVVVVVVVELAAGCGTVVTVRSVTVVLVSLPQAASAPAIHASTRNLAGDMVKVQAPSPALPAWCCPGSRPVRCIPGRDSASVRS